MSAPAFQNNVGLSDEKLQFLVERFGQLAQFGEDLPERALRYVLDDGDDSVLATLAGCPTAAEALQLLCGSRYGPEPHSGWCAFLNTARPKDAEFCLRLAKVLAASARSVPQTHFYCQTPSDGLLWLEILLQEAMGAHAWTLQTCTKEISGRLIEAMLEADGKSGDIFVRALFSVDPKDMRNRQIRQMILQVADLGTTIAAHRDLVAPFLTTGIAESRCLAVENLVLTRAPIAPFVAELAACATESSKRLREAAVALLRTEPETARPHLERIARDGDRTEREHAVRTLGSIVGADAREFLQSLQETESSRPVKAAIASALQYAPAADAQSSAAMPTAPLEEPLVLDAPVTPALRQALRRMLDDCNQRIAKHNADFQAITQQGVQRYIFPQHEVAPLSNSDLEDLCRVLESPALTKPACINTLWDMYTFWNAPKGAFRAFLEHPDCRVIHVVRLAAAAEDGGSGRMGTTESRRWMMGLQLDVHHASHRPPTTLKQVAAALRSLELSDDILTELVLKHQFIGQVALDWEPETVWPFLQDKIEWFQSAFDPPTADWQSKYRQAHAFDIALHTLAKFPTVPPALVGTIWECAIGPNQADRLQAQKVAQKLPDVQERLAQALTSGSFQTRSIAAEWLGRLGDPRAIAALDAAARKEKQDAALDEILTALERLGQPIEPYLDRDRLAREAAKGLKKGIPADLAWFPWATLPAVRWQDTGEQAPVELITWLLVQNYKLKSAEAGPLLRRYCALLRAPGREQLGDFVLQAWLTQDLHSKYTEEEARALARQKAQVAMSQVQHATQWYQQQNMPPSPQLSWSQSQWEDAHYKQILQTAGSAVNTKGILAVAGACCGAAAVAPVQKYLKEWYGYRAAQCKALIAMLSTIDHPSAIQYLLSISNRFRTKGIREEAEKYVKLLAERKGWTLDELGDRTLPTAGLDEDGTLTLDFGPRQFVLRVNAELEPVLADGEDKVLKSLPAPRKDDDAELAKAAKKAFSSAKSDLKKFADLQRSRLYEAMCTQRAWPVTDWRTYLLGHPLMRFLCQRLIWSSWRDGKLQQTFRPLDDGTFTDSADEEITLADDVDIRIAHEGEVAPETTAAWVRHLADYEVISLFPQFGRGTWRLPEDKRRETSLTDFEGHLLQAFSLRGLATKLGYTRGQTEDGGWFHEYVKVYPGLGLEAHLEFSGNSLPEENRVVALTSFTIRRKAATNAAAWHMDGGLPLSDVPPILLYECYHDVRSIAASGSGFDPDWEKKVHL